MKNNERDIAFYEMVFRPSAPTATPNHDTNDLFTVISDAVNSEFGRKKIKLSGVEHTIELLEFNPTYSGNFAVGYIGISDSTVPVPARRHRNTKAIKFAPKGSDEDDEFGCHFFISRTPHPNGKYTFYLERMTKLGASNVQALFRHIFSSQHESVKEKGGIGLFAGPHKKGKNKDVGYGIIVDLVGIPSDKAATIVNQRLITGITLVSEDTKAPFGGKKYLRARKQDLRVQLDLQAASNVVDLFDDLKGAFKSEASKWKTARLQFDSPTEGKGSISLDTATGSILEDRFIKKVTITAISPQLPTSSGQIAAHFASKVLANPQIK